MKPKAILKILIDILMTAALLFLMGYHLWGEVLHEWVGAGMLLLFIAHHILNRNWYKTLFKGKYTAMRILMLCIDSLVLISMLAQMYSGIVMSRYVFDFLPVEGGMSLARRLHILGAYWGFLLMSAHLGLHWSMVIGMVKKRMAFAMHPKVSLLAGLFIAAYGVCVFIKRDFLTYMFLKSEFVFMDYSEPKILFYLDYLALMGSFIFVFHYAGKILRVRRIPGKSEVEQ